MKSKYLLLGVFLLLGYSLSATHNRAGQILFQHISGYTYKITIITYTYTLSQADRDTLDVDFGDGTTGRAGRYQKTTLPNNYYENFYEIIHTYPGQGIFSIVVEDPNRNEGVVNIPNSVNVVFALKTTILINPFIGHNNAPVLLNRPIDKAALHQLFVHNPGAFDPDGDFLTYKMDTCRFDGGEKIPTFQLPEASDSIYVVPSTGDLIWDTPVALGIYNVALRIEEWRNGIVISNIIRDIQIEVEDTDNRPPVIDPIEDICVVAGEYIEFEVTATDPDNDFVTLSASGGPFTFDISPAEFTENITGPGMVTGTFRWQTHCSHIRYQPYLITFRANDDNPIVSLSAYESMHIKVIGPPTEITNAEAVNNNIIIDWQQSECENAIGYKIYRRKSDEDFEIGECITGMPEEWGYTLVGTVESRTQTQFVDQNLNPGFWYCYRVVVVFSGDFDGIVSDKMCVELAEGVPILTKASVDETDLSAGQITVEWIKPINFDTLTFVGPYRYLLDISRDLYGTNFQEQEIFVGLEGFSYQDQNINTVDNASCYKLTLQNYDNIDNEWINVGFSTAAASPFLRIVSTNRRNILYIDENTPWENLMYVVYRYNENTTDFDSIGFSYTNVYHDPGLQNLKEYCYKVKSINYYSADSLPDQIINFSQINCGTPLDTIPPCCPTITVTSDCDLLNNTIVWSMPSDSCYNDIEFINLMYTNSYDSPYQIIHTFKFDEYTYVHTPTDLLGACYYMEVIDSAGNVSVCNDFVNCVDECPYYELPNIFTPNNDGVNDMLIPYPYSFVDKIDLKIYNRWGNLVFETDDPDINWNGEHIKTGKLVPDGVYYLSLIHISEPTRPY